jgi:argininosuccinate lyase
MFQRDRGRLSDLLPRINVSPLGSGALAGVPYPISREAVAAELGFAAVSRNSLDAVSDRDYVVEFLSAAALVMTHLSRLAEEIIIWSSAEFRFIELDDGYATGSSMMPQKKNPDVAELVRGKTGRVYGHLVSLLTTLKGLPLAYNKDLQEDKEAFFDAFDTVRDSVSIFAGMVRTMRVRPDVTRAAADEQFLLATDLADYLAKRGVPFREAHEIVGRLVRHCIEHSVDFRQLPLETLRGFSPAFAEDARKVTAESSVAARDVPGGTAPSRVRAALVQARTLLETAP